MLPFLLVVAMIYFTDNLAAAGGSTLNSPVAQASLTHPIRKEASYPTQKALTPSYSPAQMRCQAARRRNSSTALATAIKGATDSQQRRSIPVIRCGSCAVMRCVVFGVRGRGYDTMGCE